MLQRPGRCLRAPAAAAAAVPRRCHGGAGAGVRVAELPVRRGGRREAYLWLAAAQGHRIADGGALGAAAHEGATRQQHQVPLYVAEVPEPRVLRPLNASSQVCVQGTEGHGREVHMTAAL